MPDLRIESCEVLDLLASLVQKSLAVYEEDEQGQGRYRLLETVRQYARDRLLESREAEAVRDRHLALFLALAEEAEPQLWSDPAWLERLEIEHDNLGAALDWCAGCSAEAGLRLAGALRWFWYIRSHFTEARQRLDAALAGRAGAEPAVQVKALCAAAHALAEHGEIERARAQGEESLALCRQAGDVSGMGWSFLALATAAHHQGRQTEAAALADKGLAQFRERDDRRGTALALHTLAVAVGWGGARPGEPGAREGAIEEESLAVSRQERYGWLIAASLGHLGYIAQDQPERARAVLEESLAINRELGNLAASAFALAGLGNVAKHGGDEDRALSFYEESLTLARESGNRQASANALCEIGRYALDRGEYERARASFAEALALATELRFDVGICRALGDLARLAHAQGDLHTARALLEQVLAHPQVPVRWDCGHLLLEWGDYGAAQSCYEEILAHLRAGDVSVSWALLLVGHAAWLQGEHGVLQSHAAEALGLFQAREDQAGLLAALESLGVAALARGQMERAARLLGAVEARREGLGYYGPGWWRLFRGRMLEAARAACLGQECAAAWAEGRALALPQAVAYALEEAGAA